MRKAWVSGEKRDNIYIYTYLLEKFNYASRERRVATRVELELVGLRVKAIKIHEQRVFFAIVGHFFNNNNKTNGIRCAGECVQGETQRTELLSFRLPVRTEDEDTFRLIFGKQGRPKVAQKVCEGAL